MKLLYYKPVNLKVNTVSWSIVVNGHRQLHGSIFIGNWKHDNLQLFYNTLCVDSLVQHITSYFTR